jgi:hypothetical protein
MSSGDFATELQQSVEDHVTFIRNAAGAAKARIAEQTGESEAVSSDATPAPPSIVSYDGAE